MTSHRLSSLGVLALFSCLAGCSWFDGLTPIATETSPQESQDGAVPAPSDEGGAGDAGDAPRKGRPDTGIDAAMDASVDGDIRDPLDAGDAGPDAAPRDPLGHTIYPPLEADLRWHPEPRRFAVVDDAPDFMLEQPRAWMLVYGGDTPHRLVSRRIDRPSEPWFDTGIWGITSSPAVVALYDGLKASHRVFFARDGKLHMLRYGEDEVELPTDGGVSDPLEAIGAEPGYTISGGNLAVNKFAPEGEDIIVVVAPALHDDGDTASYCIFEHRIAANEWSVQCTEAPIFADGADIVAASHGSRLFIIGRGDALVCRLCLIERGLDGVHAPSGLSTPEDRPLGASLALVRGDGSTPWILQLITTTKDGRVWNGTFDTKSMVLTWTALPDFPMGTYASSGEAAITAIDIAMDAHDSLSPRYLAVFALGDDGVVYYNATDPGLSNRPWKQSWVRVLSAGRDQVVLALGGITSYPTFSPSNPYQLFPSSLNVVGGERATAMQESIEMLGEVLWKDYVRPESSIPVVAAPVAGAESSVASGADIAIAATTLRGPTAPLDMTLSGSIDNASSWRSFVLTTLPAESPIEGPASALSPTVAYGGGKLHLVDLEWDLRADCSSSSDSQRIVYRRGDDLRELLALAADAPNLRVVAPSGSYSSPSMVVTEVVTEEGPGSKVHVLFNDLKAQRVHYWTLPPVGELSETEFDPTILPTGSLRLIADGLDQRVYAAVGEAERLRICDLDVLPMPLNENSCSVVTFGALTPRYEEIPFGAPQPAAQGACEPIEGQHYKCFRDGQPFSIAADRRTDKKLYVAYAAADMESNDNPDLTLSSIFLTSSTGGLEIGKWSAPVRVNPRDVGDRREYFDAEITVDSGGAIFVTYAAIEPHSADSSVQVYTTYWDGKGDTNFQVKQVASWNASRLPFDCTTNRWALGDYRDPDTIGGRALHVLRDEDGESALQVTQWLSPFSQP